MHVDGKEGGFFSKATLEHTVGNQGALGCQIRYKKTMAIHVSLIEVCLMSTCAL